MKRYELDGEEYLAATAEGLFVQLWQGARFASDHPSLNSYLTGFNNRLKDLRGISFDHPEDHEAFLTFLLNSGTILQISGTQA